LLTWNGNFGKASSRWRQLADAIGADVTFLQEVREPPPDAGTVWQVVPGRDWGSAVVSRATEMRAVPLAGYEGWVTGGELLAAPSQSREADQRFAFSVHAPTPHKTVPRTHYVDEVLRIVRSIRSLIPPRAQLTIGGDFNFASLGQRQQGESRRTTTKELHALEELATMDLVPLWQACHAGSPLPQTLRWSRNRATPYHCDGFLVHPARTIEALCEVLTSAFIESWSDHNPVVAWLPSTTTTTTDASVGLN
jgi:endonuclease/exonuclease/phosphatase family metal-dependent hydrolase